MSPRNPALCADPASRVHSPFSSSAAKKAARQSSRVTTGPQNQLGVQDTTNLQRQKGVGGGAAGASARVRRGGLWAGVRLGPDGQLGPSGWNGRKSGAGSLGPPASSSVSLGGRHHFPPSLTFLICEGAPITLACLLGRVQVLDIRQVKPALGHTVGTPEGHHGAPHRARPALQPPPPFPAATSSHSPSPAFRSRGPPEPGHPRTAEDHSHPTWQTPEPPSASSSLPNSTLSPAKACTLLLKVCRLSACEFQKGQAWVVLCLQRAGRWRTVGYTPR